MQAPNGHLICDVCGSLGEAGSERTEAFEVVDWESGGKVDLCLRCVADHRAGRLAETASATECARCGRDELSGEDEWRHIEDDAGRRTTFCVDCWVELEMG